MDAHSRFHSATPCLSIHGQLFSFVFYEISTPPPSRPLSFGLLLPGFHIVTYSSAVRLSKRNRHSRDLRPLKVPIASESLNTRLSSSFYFLFTRSVLVSFWVYVLFLFKIAVRQTFTHSYVYVLHPSLISALHSSLIPSDSDFWRRWR